MISADGTTNDEQNEKGERRRAKFRISPLSLLPYPFLEAWLAAHLDLVALLIVAAGLAIRWAAAAGGFLNADEAINVRLASLPSLAAIVRNGIGGQNPEPPLLYFILYFWRQLGNSDFMFRLPSVLAGTAALWVAFKWLKTAFDAGTALTGLMLLTFAPEMVQLSAEVRHYGLLFLLIFAALYFLERALQEKDRNGDIPALRGVPIPLRARLMGFFLVMPFLAIATHYSAVWLAVALGVYAVLRFIRDRPPGRVVGVWLGGQAATILLCIYFYVTHISKLMAGTVEQGAREGWLRTSYFHAGQDRPLTFLLDRTVSFFQYLMSSRVAGIVALLMFLAGVILLLTRLRSSPLKPLSSSALKPSSFSTLEPLSSSAFELSSARRHLGLLLLIPFAVVAGAAIAGISPYGGTRHSSVLVAFAVAGVSYALARISAGRLVPILLAGIVLIPVWRITTHPAASWYLEPKNRRRELMAAATDYIRQIVPPGRFIFTDIQTEALLWRYLGEDYPVVRPSIWSFTPDDFGDNFFRMTEARGLRIGDSVFVASAGWGENLVQGLARRQVTYPRLRQFGDNIAVFVVPVGMEPLSDTLALRVKRTARALDSSALSLRATAGATIRTVLWPSRYLTDRTASLTLHLAPRMKSYAEVYQAVRQGERAFDRYLPALAFWDLGTHEAHPEFMSYMKDGENYVAGDYRFTLLAADSDSLTAVYRIERPTP